MVGTAVGRSGESGYVAYVNVERDASGRARERLLALALAAGALDRGAFAVSAVDEAASTCSSSRAVGPYVGLAIQLAFEVGVAAGLPPEALVLELYQSGEMAEVFRSFAERGFYRAVVEHGATAQYGGYLRTLDLDTERCARSSPPCSTTSAAAASPRSSRPRRPPARRRCADRRDDGRRRSDEPRRAGGAGGNQRNLQRPSPARTSP